MPKQKVEAEEKKGSTNSSKLSYILNLCFEVFIGFHFCLLIFLYVLMPIVFVCIVIIGIPVLWSGLCYAYNFVLSIGWNGVAEAVFVPLGLFLGLRVLHLWKSLRSKNERLTFSKMHCVISHDYVIVGGHDEPSDPMFDYWTVDSKCRRCSSTKSETRAYSKEDFR